MFFLRKSHENGFRKASEKLGKFLLRGENTEQDVEGGLKLLEDVAKLGSGNAYCELGLFYKRSDPTKAFVMFEKGDSIWKSLGDL